MLGYSFHKCGTFGLFGVVCSHLMSFELIWIRSVLFLHRERTLCRIYISLDRIFLIHFNALSNSKLSDLHSNRCVSSQKRISHNSRIFGQYVKIKVISCLSKVRHFNVSFISITKHLVISRCVRCFKPVCWHMLSAHRYIVTISGNWPLTKYICFHSDIFIPWFNFFCFTLFRFVSHSVLLLAF